MQHVIHIVYADTVLAPRPVAAARADDENKDKNGIGQEPRGHLRRLCDSTGRSSVI